MKKTIVIAEAGVNHNKSLKIAKKLVDIAKKSGADYVKFQSFNHNKLTTKNAKKAKYQMNSKKETQREMLKKLELSENQQLKLIDYCKKKKIKFLSTAFDIESLKFLLKNKIDYIKIPSGEITNYLLLDFISKQKKKVLLSTGASSLEEIKNAISILNKNKKKNITVLQCTSSYPAKLEELNINVLKTFKKKFNINLGLSDHSLSKIASVAAITLGASVIEKHFTLSRKMKGPDHKASLEPKELFEMIKNIRETEKILGSAQKKISKNEKINIPIMRKSIVALNKINKGEIFSIKNLTLKRPGTGISPLKFNMLIGKKSKFNFKKDDFIKV